MVVGECMPMPDPKLLASMLDGFGGIEGYVATKSFTMAVFRSKIKDGKVQVQKNMLRPFKDGEAVFAIVMTQRSTQRPTKKPIHPAIIEAQKSAAARQQKEG